MPESCRPIFEWEHDLFYQASRAAGTVAVIANPQPELEIRLAELHATHQSMSTLVERVTLPSIALRSRHWRAEIHFGNHHLGSFWKKMTIENVYALNQR